MRDRLRCVAFAMAVSALACAKEGGAGQSGGGAGGGRNAASDVDAGDGGRALPPQAGDDGGAPSQLGDAGGAPLALDDAGGPGASDPSHAGAAGDASEPEPAVDGSAGPDVEVSCLGGGDDVESSATGACDDPIVVDLRGAELGEVFAHQTQGTATDGLPTGLGKCAATTEREVVYQVMLPSEADLEVSVGADEGADPIILVQDGPDPTCSEAAPVACVDDYGTDTCEYLRVAVSAGGFEDDVAQVVIAETIASGRALHVRFRVADPAGGS